MAPSPEPSIEKPVDEEPSSEDEQSEDDEGSQSHSSEEEKEKYSNDFSGETGQDEDEDLKQSKSKIDSKVDSNSESDLGSPSSYKLQPVSRFSKSTSKRTHGDESQRPVINSKKSKSEEGKSVGSSSGCINRLWSDNDEITVLNGLIEFKNNIGALHNFIKGKLEANFSKDQLNSKIRRMKKRFLKNRDENPVFSNPHEDKTFELSKRIWGGIEKVELDEKELSKRIWGGIEKVELDEKEMVKDEMDEKNIVKDENDGDKRVFCGTKYPFLSHSFENLSSVMPSLDMSKSGMSFALNRLSSSKAKELDEKWKLLIKEEFELNHKKLTLMKEQMNMALDSDEEVF